MVINEVRPGLYQIGDILGPRYVYQYLLKDRNHSLLIDTGIKGAPEKVILPALKQIGLSPGSLTFCINSHSDVDHFGGNGEIRKACPKTILAAHAADARWIQNKEAILAERYGWYKQHGMGYGDEVERWLADAMGEDTPLDLLLQGGEVLHLGPDRPIEILHIPGHSDGHLGFYDRRNKALIVIDAILGKGLYDMQGKIIHPPPYFVVAPYLASVDKCLALETVVFLTGHFPNYERKSARQFLLDTKAFVKALERTVTGIVRKADRSLTLAEIKDAANAHLGPFTSFDVELAGPVRAHLRDLMAAKRVRTGKKGGVQTFQWKG